MEKIQPNQEFRQKLFLRLMRAFSIMQSGYREQMYIIESAIGEKKEISKLSERELLEVLRSERIKRVEEAAKV